LTTGEVAAHFAEVYDAGISRDTISRITDEVVEEMTEWRNRPLGRVYPVIFIDAIVVKVRDGQVVNRPSMWSSASGSTVSRTSSGCGRRRRTSPSQGRDKVARRTPLVARGSTRQALCGQRRLVGTVHVGSELPAKCCSLVPPMWALRPAKTRR
jgi:hypothetical protein